MCADLILCLALICSLVIPAGDRQKQESARSNLVLTVREPRDKTKEILGSTWYVLDLLNNGDKSERLEAIVMHGDTGGSGRFFNCGLDTWNVDRRQWIPLRREKRSDYDHNPIEKVEVEPGEKLEVCANLLPSQAGSPGQCVRFTLRQLWSEKSSDILVSKPFSIGEKAAPRDSPCLVD